MIKAIGPDGDAPDLAELNRMLSEVAEAYNRQPNPEIGGFTPEMLFRLMRTEWNAPDCPLQLGTDLPLPVLSAAPVFTGMRNLLLHAAGKGGLALTAKGFLTRAVVAEAVDWFLSEKEKGRFFSYSKVMNEADCMAIWRARIVMEMAGMLHKSKGRLVVPKNKLPLLEEEAAGDLAARLFVAYFRKYNHLHLTRYPAACEAIQHDAEDIFAEKALVMLRPFYDPWIRFEA